MRQETPFLSPKEVLEMTWDGVGDWFKGNQVMYGSAKDIYTMEDIK